MLSVMLIVVYAECRVYNVMLSVFMLSVLMLNVIVLGVVMLNVNILGVVAPLQVPSGSRIQTCNLGPMLKKICP
jgi:hypothetical protein